MRDRESHRQRERVRQREEDVQPLVPTALTHAVLRWSPSDRNCPVSLSPAPPRAPLLARAGLSLRAKEILCSLAQALACEQRSSGPGAGLSRPWPRRPGSRSLVLDASESQPRGRCAEGRCRLPVARLEEAGVLLPRVLPGRPSAGARGGATPDRAGVRCDAGRRPASGAHSHAETGL